MKEKVIAALSGGVDSSVAAALAMRAGYEVIGVTLRLKHPDPAFSAIQLCASKNDEAAVDQVVRTLGIEHHYIEAFERFREQVLEPAAREYLSGRTPNPCCDCNPLVKFGALVDFAEKAGAPRVLTGHYAKITRESTGFVLWRGDDPAKDQSYFLYRLTQRELSKLMFRLERWKRAKSGKSPRNWDLRLPISRTARTPVSRSRANVSAKPSGGSAGTRRGRAGSSIAAGGSAATPESTPTPSGSARGSTSRSASPPM